MGDGLRKIALSLVVVAGCATGGTVTGFVPDGLDANSPDDGGGPADAAAESGRGETGVAEGSAIDSTEAEDAAVPDGSDDGNAEDASGQSDAKGSEAESVAEGGDAGDGAAPDGAETGDASEAGVADASGDGGDSGASSEAGEAGGSTTDSGDASRPDAGGGIPMCPQSTNDGAGVYVTPTGTDATGCGASRGSPCQTLAGAIASTSYYQGRNIVFVGAGTYVESVTPAAGITIMGGWQVSGSTWSFDCGPHPEADVIVRAPSSANTTVLVDGIHGAVTLSTLTLQSKAAANAGESLYGVFARGSTTDLTLTNVVVTMATAGDGQTPAQADGGAAPTSSCSAGDGDSATTPGAIGAGASSGTFSSAAFTPAAGAAGSSGSSGDNGTAAPAPTPVPYASCTGTACTNSSASCTGQQGSQGCGGGGGSGGAGGGGGGSSIALFAFDANVTVTGGSYTAGYGGNGGSGGAGGTGTGGSTGAAGKGASCTSSTCQAAVLCIGNIPNNNITASGGAAGGAGGTGSAGGKGGGGSGGDSYAIITGGAATAALTLLDSPLLASGAPGTSLGNGSAGMAGARASF